MTNLPTSPTLDGMADLRTTREPSRRRDTPAKKHTRIGRGTKTAAKNAVPKKLPSRIEAGGTTGMSRLRTNAPAAARGEASARLLARLQRMADELGLAEELDHKEEVVLTRDAHGLWQVTLRAAKTAAPAPAAVKRRRRDPVAPRPNDTPDVVAALEAARERGRQGIAGFLKRPEMLTDRAFAARLGISHTTVHARRRANQLLAVGGAARGFRYPDWQIDPHTGQAYPEIGRLLRALRDPWVVYRMFATMRHHDLGGRTGLDLLRAGEGEALARLVEQRFPPD